MKILLDTHSHTTVSGHAYATLNEMVYAASEKGLKLICVTDHAPKMPGGPDVVYFKNFKAVDRYIHDVEVFMGVELNILDYDGGVDLPDNVISKLDVVIASFHPICLKPGSKEENTNAFLKVMDNPYVHILGHPEDGKVPIDFELVVKKAKRTNTLIELNNGSLKPGGSRFNSYENAKKLLDVCRQEGAFITISSDAHYTSSVGEHAFALNLIKETNFPEELIINTSVEKFKNFIRHKQKSIWKVFD